MTPKLRAQLLKAGRFFKVKIIKHTPLLFGNIHCDGWHVDAVGKVILVKKTEWDGAYYEAKNDNSILKTDCHPIKIK